MKTNLRFNKMCVFALTLVVCLLASMFLTSLVKADGGPILSNELRHIFRPFFVENNGSQTITDRPYMAGYMTTDYLSGNPDESSANAVRVTVSFRGTDNSIIQDGNALAAGIAAQGPSTSGGVPIIGPPWIDYGYNLLLVVDNQYDWPYIQGMVWEVMEWGAHNLWPIEDPVVTLVDYFTWEFPEILTMDSDVTLIMKWDSDPDVLSFSAIIDDYPEVPIQTSNPDDIQLPYFMLGTDERSHPVVSLTGTAKFFQFVGAWSDENIGQEGWHSYLSYPGFKRFGNSSWTNVPFAYSVNGTTSWLDNTVNWGGACYDNVNADYTYMHVHFYPTSDGATLEPDTLLWASRTLSISACPYGTTNPAPGTYAYDYGSSVSVTAIPDSGHSFDYWLLDGAPYVENPITVTMYDNHTLEANFKIDSGGGGGGACPTLFVWNGTDYAEEGVLDIHAESDLTIQHQIQNTLTLKNGVYKLQLRELDNHTSHIDQVKLYAVDDQGEWHWCPLIFAYHNELGQVTWTLFFDDENRVDLTPTQTTSLRFLPTLPYSQTAYFIFEINGYNAKGNNLK